MGSYKKQVGIVSQDSHIFSETIAFNISLQNELTDDLKTFF